MCVCVCGQYVDDSVCKRVLSKMTGDIDSDVSPYYKSDKVNSLSVAVENNKKMFSTRKKLKKTQFSETSNIRD